jgi:hypothetical protein
VQISNFAPGEHWQHPKHREQQQHAMSDSDVLRMLENALEDDDISIAGTEAELVTKMGRGVQDLDLNAPSLATMSVADSRDFGGGRYDDFDDDDDDLSIADSNIQLPSYPTPYEVWQSKQQKGKSRKETLRLKKQDMDKVIARLNSSGRKKQEQLSEAQHRQIAEEIKNASFVPEINSKSRELNDQNHVQRLPDRQDALLAARDANLKKQRELKVEKELHHMQDGPDVTASHDSWRRIKAKQHIMVNRDRRTVNDLLKYGEDRRTRQMQRRMIAHEDEDREATFSPQINQHSLRLHARMVKSGRDVRRDPNARSGKQRVIVGGTGTAHDPGHEEELFEPKINKRSKAVPTAGGKAHNRLYEQGLASTRRRQEREQVLMEATLKDVPQSAYQTMNSTRKTKQDTQMQASQNEAEMDIMSVLNANATDVMSGKYQTTNPDSVTEVEYNPKMDFIFQLFDAPVPAM